MSKEFSWCYCCGVVTCYMPMAVYACRYALAHLNLAPSPCSLPNQEAGGNQTGHGDGHCKKMGLRLAQEQCTVFTGSKLACSARHLGCHGGGYKSARRL